MPKASISRCVLGRGHCRYYLTGRVAQWNGPSGVGVFVVNIVDPWIIVVGGEAACSGKG
jgi:hypothetical protein